ncbi:DedA family protein [Compostimonas suwonensis]|uniref:Membrane protein DedA with SNARE-associated domain n=1 Tax=Compostimonas suwonensis TaxID=1048394 RepID=A0A2M9BZV5_9MICO|nr:DedA family protein [Compostimonas suwonensis]PJJ63613.1 membrane protein DedA with SNARE-associated domain [Compostimonas suwonensis]
MEAINDLLMGLAGSPWVYLAVLLVCIVDGFFPPIPSESVVVGLAALALSAGQPNIVLVIALAAAGAAIGDNIAYAIGRGIGTTRFAWMRRPRVASTFAWARAGLDQRGALLIVTARYIPVGRIAVNMTAGATRYPRRRFVSLSIVAGISWALYSAFIGVAVGHLLGDQPLLAIVVSIVLAAAIGYAVDAVSRAVSARRAARAQHNERAERADYSSSASSLGSSNSFDESSSTLTSLNVSTRTDLTNLSER